MWTAFISYFPEGTEELTGSLFYNKAIVCHLLLLLLLCHVCGQQFEWATLIW
jgi:hypothetical protein